jgi:hypothetical protein
MNRKERHVRQQSNGGTTGGNAIDAFVNLEREHDERFASLAKNFDFLTAEQQALEALSNVHRLADRAREMLDGNLDYTPQTLAVGAEEYHALHQRYLTLEAELFTFFNSLGIGNGKKPSGRAVAIPTTTLTRLHESFRHVSGNQQ